MAEERRPRSGERKQLSRRDGEKKPYAKRDGDKKPYAKRDGDKKPYAKRDGDKKPYAKRDGDRRSSRPPQDSDRRVGPPAPPLPADVTPRDLNGAARNELKTLSKENAEQVARHLAMAARLIDDDPALAHQHALAASRSAGRIAIVRETVAITAYALGDFALAVRELRTYRRISGRDDQIALLVDSERGVGRPDRALEVGRAVDRSTLPTEVRVELAIAMSGARLDLGETERALQELDIPELDPDRAFAWSPGLFAARAAVLEELGRTEEAAAWQRRAEIAEEAIGARDADREVLEIDEVEEIPLPVDDHTDVPADGPAAAPRTTVQAMTTARREALMALFGRRASRTPLDGVDAVLADLDGVVYAGPGALPHAIESLNAAATGGRRLGYITNNASAATRLSRNTFATSVSWRRGPRTSSRVRRRRCASCGSGCPPVRRSSSLAETVWSSRSRRPASSSRAAPTMHRRPSCRGSRPTSAGSIWLRRPMHWRHRRTRAASPGSPRTLTGRFRRHGDAAGNGTLVSAVHTAVGRLAVVAGKPERPIFDEAVARFDAPASALHRRPARHRHRRCTDGGHRLGPRAHRDRPAQARAWAPPTSRPTYILADLRELHEEYPETVVRGEVTSVRDAAVRIDGADIHIVAAGTRPIDLVRAGAAAIWASGRAIYGFRVPEQLYADPFHRP